MKPDDDLSLWADDFKEPLPDEAAPSAEAIVAQVARDTRKERLGLAYQLAALLFAVLVFLALVARTKSIMFAVFAAIVLPTLVLSVVLTVHFRRMTWKQDVATVAGHVALSVRRRRAELRIAKVNQIVMWLLTTAFWVWFPIFVFSRADKFGAEPWRLVVGATGSLIVFTAAAWAVTRSVRRARAELARWEKIESALVEDPAAR